MPHVLQAQLLGLLREAEKGIGLARDEQVHGVVHALASDPRHLVLRVDAHVRQHARDQDMVPIPDILDGHRLAFEVADRTHLLLAEQLVAASVHAGQQDDRFAGVQMRDQAGCVPHGDVTAAVGERVGAISRPQRQVLHVGEPVKPQ